MTRAGRSVGQEHVCHFHANNQFPQHSCWRAIWPIDSSICWHTLLCYAQRHVCTYFGPVDRIWWGEMSISQFRLPKKNNQNENTQNQIVTKQRKHYFWMRGVWLCWTTEIFPIDLDCTKNGQSLIFSSHKTALDRLSSVFFLSDCELFHSIKSSSLSHICVCVCVLNISFP